MIESVSEEDNDKYCGFRDITPSQTELISFYESSDRNIFNCLTNEYIILRDEAHKIIDVRKWTGQEYAHLNSLSFDSNWFGKIKPMDVYQKMAMDSLASNKLTILRGPAGSGKSHIALAYLMQALQRNQIDRIVLFCNPVATMNAAKLGFYSGSKNEKLLDSQIGNFLTSKFGDQEGVNRLIESNQLMLIPLSDARGIDLSGMKAGVYVTEAQNMDRSLIKLVLQRVGNDSICILDGDDMAQVDMNAYSGNNNGLKRVSQVFRGQDIYGEVTLQEVYRSEIARIAEEV